MSSNSQTSDVRTYVRVLAALLTLTAITVAAAGVDFGQGNIVIALAIATGKATLVALFFMHLRHEKPMNAVIFCCGFAFLGIFLALTMADTETREPFHPANPPRVAAPPALKR